MVITGEGIEVRICVVFPARGRSIERHMAKQPLLGHIYTLAKESLLAYKCAVSEFEAHVNCVEDQEELRVQLASLGLVSFVKNGAILPRQSGASQLPLKESAVVPFTSPPRLEVTVQLSNSRIIGMGLPHASLVVLIRAGFHGKSTLLDAISLDRYNYVPGDGREFMCSVESVSNVASEDGRPISSVDVSSFIINLPVGKSTKYFSTSDASGSTSCAATLTEALEIASELLCIDEHTTAANWLACSPVMARLIGKESIIHLERRAREIVKQTGTTLMLVCGNSTEYLAQADLILKLEDFVCLDVTAQAKESWWKSTEGGRAQILSYFLALGHIGLTCFSLATKS